MKKYIQPTSATICLHAECAIMAASKFDINKSAAEGDALSNKKQDMWGHKSMWD